MKDKKFETKYKKSSRKKSKLNLVQGRFICHAKGFGFVEVENSEEDLYIAEENTGAAFHRDLVEVQMLSLASGKRKEGRIVSVVEHEISRVVGTFERKNHFGFVLADDKRIVRDIYVPMEQAMNAETGHKVIVEIEDYGNLHKSPEGKIVEILGFAKDVGVDVLSIAMAHELPVEFPDKVKKQADRVKDYVIENDFQGREDLRSFLMVTIDGEDAKDLDDAVSLEKKGDEYLLGVHIADVSNYVQYKSALDREALKRGTSVYLVDRVIPMLPERLSNGICSLNAGADRLALTCFMKLDKSGKIIDHQIVESVIRVDQRMTYTNVQKIFDGEKEIREQYKDVVPMLEMMHELSLLIRERRDRRGAIGFDFPECKILLNGNGQPVEIKPYLQNDATRLIEDFMLSANETVAREFSTRKIPFLYRIHEEPDADRMEEVLSFLRNLGVNVMKKGERITPKEIDMILTDVEGTKEEGLISRLLLRSMKQACYSTENAGHFGLSASYYTHFTSPIRRYPDLQIHRIIKDDLRNRLKEEKIESYKEMLPSVAEQSSMKERRAEQAERDCDKLKKAEYMLKHIGEYFDGIISGVTSYGLYVALPDTVEGLVHISSIEGDYFVFDEEQHRLIGQTTKRTYTLGQEVTIRVKDVDMENRTIDFLLRRDRR